MIGKLNGCQTKIRWGKVHRVCKAHCCIMLHVIDFQDSKEARYRSVSECSSADSGIAGDLQAHERLVVGTFIDPNICSGFMYRVRPLMARKKLFKGYSILFAPLSIKNGF